MTRIGWIDYAKGIAILLVVIGHVLRGLISSQILIESPLTQYIDNWIYSFHMPVFFMIAGLFVLKSAQKSLIAFLSDKLCTIVYPYFLWSTIQSIIMIAFAGSTNNNIKWADIWKIIYQPIMQFWFLYALFIMLLIFITLYKMRVPLIGIFLLTLIVFCLKFYLPTDSHVNSLVQSTCANMVFFGIGFLGRDVLLNRLSKLSTEALIKFSLASFISLSVLVVLGLQLNYFGRLVTASLGIIGTISLSTVLERLKLASEIQRYGLLSLHIFLAHIIMAAAARIILMKVFKIDNSLIHLGLGTLAGTYGPILLQNLSQKARFPYLFTSPRLRTD